MKTIRIDNLTLRCMVFFLLALLGLAYVKWFPYYQRTFFAASHHSIGASLLTGTDSASPQPSIAAAIDYAWAYGRAIWKAMVLGLLLGSAVQVLVPQQWVAMTLGAAGFRSLATAGLLSIPAMMCTCCAAPVVAGLRSCRASPAAAITFWLGNTMLNPAALVFMGFVLGWHWSMLRLVFGFVMVFGIGYLVSYLTNPTQTQPVKLPPTDDADGDKTMSVFSRWMSILTQMSLRLLPEYAVLVLLLGAARAWLFPHIGPEVDNDLLWIGGFALAGAMFVIPTAAEIPIVQSMLLLGVGVGPAAALLMTLPPISVPSLAMLLPSFPLRALALVVGSVFALALAASFTAIALGF